MGRLLCSSRESGEGMMGWLEAESSVLRLVTGVVLLGGIGGEGLAGTRLAPPVAWAKSPAKRKRANPTVTAEEKQLQLRRVSDLLASALLLNLVCHCDTSAQASVTHV